MGNITDIQPDILQQDKKRLERLSADIGKLYRSISDLPNYNANAALCIACRNGADLTIDQFRQGLTTLGLIIDRTLRGILERQGLPPSKRTLRRVKEVIKPWEAWWAPYFSKPSLFEFTTNDIERLASSLGRFPHENVRAFIGHHPQRLLVRTELLPARINGVLIEGVELHVRGWIAERRRFQEQMPSKKVRTNPRPSRTYDIEQLQLLAGRAERIQGELLDGGLYARLTSGYVYVHESDCGEVQEAHRLLRSFGQVVSAAVDLVRTWPDIRKPFDRNLVADLAIDYRLAFGVMPSAEHDETIFMKFLAELQQIVARHRYRVIVPQIPPRSPRVVELSLRHKLEIGRYLARRVIKEELNPV